MDKFIVFTNRYKVDNQQIPTEDYGTNWKNFAVKDNSITIAFGGLENVPEHINTSQILFVDDIDWHDEPDRVKCILIKYINGTDKSCIYVILHKSSRYNDNRTADGKIILGHKGIIKEVLSDSAFENFIEENHEPGSVYHEQLKNLINIVNGNSRYNSLLEEIKKKFPNLILETKLELLHSCLTPTKAKCYTFSEILKKGKDSSTTDFEEKFKEFQRKIINKTNEDTFNPKYIQALKDLRDQLLIDK